MRKIYGNRKIDAVRAYIGATLLCILLIAITINLISGILNISNPLPLSSALYTIIVFGIISFLAIFLGNRFSCQIWTEDGYLKRKGLFFGYKKEVKINEIKRVILYNQIYYIIDSQFELTDHILNINCIKFSQADDHEDFLKSFWNGPIEDYYSLNNLF